MTPGGAGGNVTLAAAGLLLSDVDDVVRLEPPDAAAAGLLVAFGVSLRMASRSSRSFSPVSSSMAGALALLLAPLPRPAAGFAAAAAPPRAAPPAPRPEALLPTAAAAAPPPSAFFFFLASSSAFLRRN